MAWENVEPSTFRDELRTHIAVVQATAPDPAVHPVWYDSTNDLLKRWDGAAWIPSGSGTYRKTFGPTVGEPIVPAAHSFGQRQMDADRVYPVAIIPVEKSRTLAKITAGVTTAGNGSSVIRFGSAQVASDGSVVGETLTEHGQIDGTTASTQQITAIGHSVAAGILVIFALTNGETDTTPTVFSAVPTNAFGVGFGTGNDGGNDLLRDRIGKSAATHGSAMPSTVPGMDVGGINNGPAVYVEFS